eukprot:TRINITY_DN18038_c0_g1_i1.p2 TRINITY_DN18038_c0_g1~~TRINITY_DN18038_c0_g1_i1.p2  ORF type:complete len:116 (+),score=16.86 TRINITY_DN18038_c0_g1_i1:514-861(+)
MQDPPPLKGKEVISHGQRKRTVPNPTHQFQTKVPRPSNAHSSVLSPQTFVNLCSLLYQYGSSTETSDFFQSFQLLLDVFETVPLDPRYSKKLTNIIINGHLSPKKKKKKKKKNHG